jgi:predicted transcriptional regulator
MANCTKELGFTSLFVHSKYRSNIELIGLILEAVKNNDVTRYPLMRYTGINYAQLKKYLGCLIEMGFIEAHEKDGQVLYRARERGLDFLRQYYVLLGTLLNAYTRNETPEAICQEVKCDSSKGQRSFTARFAAS